MAFFIIAIIIAGMYGFVLFNFDAYDSKYDLRKSFVFKWYYNRRVVELNRRLTIIDQLLARVVARRKKYLISETIALINRELQLGVRDIHLNLVALKNALPDIRHHMRNVIDEGEFQIRELTHDIGDHHHLFLRFVRGEVVTTFQYKAAECRQLMATLEFKINELEAYRKSVATTRVPFNIKLN